LEQFMANWKIDRLTLKVPGMSRVDAESLGRRVAEDLATRSLQGGASIRLGAVRQTTTAAPDQSVETLSGRIVDELVRSLERMA
jgi:hypothetical protein